MSRRSCPNAAAMVGGTRGCIRATSSGQSLLRCSAASPRRSTRLIDPTERRQSPPLPGTGDLRGSPAGRCELPRDDDPMSAAGSGAQQTSCRCASSYRACILAGIVQAQRAAVFETGSSDVERHRLTLQTLVIVQARSRRKFCSWYNTCLVHTLLFENDSTVTPDAVSQGA